MSVQVIGLKEANRALRGLPDLAKGEAQQVMDVTAFQVARHATAAAPAPTADSPHHEIALKDAITWARRRGSAVVGVDSRAYHWKYVEYGTVHMHPRPMFRPAAATEAPNHRSRLEAALTRAASRMAQAQG